MASNGKSRSKSEDENGLAQAYLAAYNVCQILGWSAILLVLVSHFLENGNVRGVYNEMSALLYLFQTAAVLEILHSAVGLVRSSVMLTGFQVFSRVFMIWGIMYSVPEVRSHIGVYMFLMAWTITEIVRYTFYFFALLGQVPYSLQWCRYTFFLVLYPIGVTGELLTVYASLPYVKKAGMYSINLPNTANVSFSFYYFLLFFMLSYIPVFPQLFLHMFSQRKKIIGGAGRPKTE